MLLEGLHYPIESKRRALGDKVVAMHYDGDIAQLAIETSRRSLTW